MIFLRINQVVACRELAKRMTDVIFPDTPEVLIRIATPGNGRRVHWLSALLHAMAMEHAAYVPWWRPGVLSRGVRRKLAGTHCNVLRRSLSPKRLLITDQPAVSYRGKKILLSFSLERLHTGLLEPGSLAVPIMFHPNLLTPDSYAAASIFARKRDRPIKILFAGNCTPEIYDKPRMGQRFGLLNRHELHRLAASFGDERIVFPASYGELKDAMEEGALKDRFVWIDTDRFAIPQAEWFHLLSKAEYFCCAPGVAYPYCHNLNESMACGCVPIIQYGDWLSPKLRSGIDCVAFASDPEFVDRVTRVLLGEFDTDWPEMSNSASRYHHRYLSLEACSSAIRDFLDDPLRTEMTWVVAGKD